jgi:hypothetical protein
LPEAPTGQYPGWSKWLQEPLDATLLEEVRRIFQPVKNLGHLKGCRRTTEAVNTGMELDRAGFAVVPDAIEPPRVDELISALAALGTSYGLRNLLRRCPAVRRLAQDLKPFVTPCLGERAFAVRGLLFDKLPGANWEVAWHQDLSIAVAERRGGAWFHRLVG